MKFPFTSQDPIEVTESAIAQWVDKLETYLAQHNAQVAWQYQIPELGEGGACSLFGHLQEEPFALEQYVSQKEEQKMNNLQAIVDFVIEQSGVEWFGIYQIRQIEEQSQLLKLAYYGAPSRPLFPVNEAFAQTSNNVQVVYNASGRVINNVQSYVANGGEYYTCDPKVKAETCLPLFDDSGKVVGIVDAEAFANDFFTPERVALCIAACKVSVQHLPN